MDANWENSGPTRHWLDKCTCVTSETIETIETRTGVSTNYIVHFTVARRWWRGATRYIQTRQAMYSIRIYVAKVLNE